MPRRAWTVRACSSLLAALIGDVIPCLCENIQSPRHDMIKKNNNCGHNIAITCARNTNSWPQNTKLNLVCIGLQVVVALTELLKKSVVFSGHLSFNKITDD